MAVSSKAYKYVPIRQQFCNIVQMAPYDVSICRKLAGAAISVSAAPVLL